MRTRPPEPPAGPIVAPYDPADSPGPIPSVIARFRRRPATADDPADERAAAVARYTVVLVTPEAAEPLGFDRCDIGLKIFHDGVWECDPAYLDEAALIVEEDCGIPVTLTERRSDLTYWTAKPRA